MSFIVPLMTVGVLAGSIPVIIHLFNRTRYRTVRWGAMHLLDSVVRVNRRRIRIEQLILLLIRIGIPVAIALFMAGPVLTGWRVLPGDVKSSASVLLDNSYSMEAGGGDQSNFSRSKKVVDRIITGLKDGSEVSLIQMASGSGNSLEQSTVDLDGLRRRLELLSGGFGMAHVPGSLEKAVALVSKMHYSKRDIVVVSDFQRVSWGAGEKEARDRVVERINSIPVKPTLTFFRPTLSYHDNLCVESIEFSKLIVGTGQKVKVKAMLKNYGRTPWKGLRVRFSVDGKLQEMSGISLGEGERSQVIFSCIFKDPGSHYVEVKADADPLSADNSMFAAIQVWDRVPVLLVCGEKSTEPLQSETDYLKAALQPFSAGGVKLTDLVDPKVIGTGELGGGTIQENRVVVLANVAKLNDNQLKDLEDFVSSGGGLLIFPGSKCDLSWYRSAMFKSGNGLLPFAFSLPSDGPAIGTKSTSIAGQHFDHEALEMFNFPENGSLTTGEIRKWLLLGEGGPGSNQPPGVDVIAELETGDPFLAGKSYGKGRVIQCATACDADWSNLPLKPYYLPLMQQLTTYLASSAYPPRNLEVGKPLVVFAPLSMQGKKLKVTCLADGKEYKITLRKKGIRTVGEFLGTGRPGLYLVSGFGFGPVYFVINTSRAESILDSLTSEELSAMAGGMNADVVTSSAEYARLESSRRHGREMWRYFFWAAVGLIFGELLLQRFFARRKKVKSGKNMLRRELGIPVNNHDTQQRKRRRP